MRLWLFLAVSVSVLAASAQQNHIPGKANPFDAPEVQAGKQLFQQTCGLCHGPEARGGEGPNLIDSTLVRHDEHGNLIAPLLHQGRTDKGMPAFTYLDEKQIAGIVDFLHAALEAADNRSSGGPATGYTRQQLLTGDAQAGKLFFTSNCSACHSITGDLAGVAHKYPPLELEHRILYPSLTARTATVSLADGEKFKGNVVHLDSFFVAITDANGNYHSWPLVQDTRVVLDEPLRGHKTLLSRYHDKDIHDVFAYLETLP